MLDVLLCRHFGSEGSLFILLFGYFEKIVKLFDDSGYGLGHCAYPCSFSVELIAMGLKLGL